MTPALKEWAAVIHALLDGRQTVLLRKGGIHEKRFAVAATRALLFPTVAHSHAASTRPEHHDLLARGLADVGAQDLTLRAGVEVVAAIPVQRPGEVGELEPFHVWTTASVQENRIDFRPRHQLAALVVRAYRLPEVRLERDPAYGGCLSWLEVPVPWPHGLGAPVVADSVLAEVAREVRARVG